MWRRCFDALSGPMDERLTVTVSDLDGLVGFQDERVVRSDFHRGYSSNRIFDFVSGRLFECCSSLGGFPGFEAPVEEEADDDGHQPNQDEGGSTPLCMPTSGVDVGCLRGLVVGWFVAMPMSVPVFFLCVVVAQLLFPFLSASRIRAMLEGSSPNVLDSSFFGSVFLR